MNVLFVRPPRHYWPLMSPAGAFWQPLAFACLAAQVRRDLPQTGVRILDAPILRMGWRTLARELAAARPDVLCIGDEVSAAGEGLRLARLARSQNPCVRIVAGGCFFGAMARDLIATEPLDVIVRGEGERTLVAVLRRLDNAATAGTLGDDPIQGAVFRTPDGRVVDGGAAELIDDLDTLPVPAWDLLPMPRYGRAARSHRRMATIEHSRGCIDSCSFCILWRQMGRPTGSNGDVRSCWRTKSPERTFDELRLLYEQYGRRTFCWTDPTWNASAEWTDRFCDLVLRWGRPVEMVAWLRADCVVRDAALGILDKQVAAGLRRVMIGLERDSDEDVAALGKHGCGRGVSTKALELLAKYPQVYTIASLIFAVPGESAASASRLVRCGDEADAKVLLPLTPNPGTPEWREARRAGRLATEDLGQYNFLNPVVRANGRSQRQLTRLYGRAVARSTLRSLAYWATHFNAPVNRGKIALAARLGWRAARIAAQAMLTGGPVRDRRPRWYDD